MDAEQRVLEALSKAESDGVLQSQLAAALRLSKSTISEILTKLEEEGRIVRRKVAAKSYRVWLVEYAPFAVEGIARVGILRASEYPKVVGAAKKIDAHVRVLDSAMELTRELVGGCVDIAASPLITQVFFGTLMGNIKIRRIVAMNGSGLVFGNPTSEWFGCSEFSTMELNLRRYFAKTCESGKIRYFRSANDMINALEELKGIAVWEPYYTMLSSRKRVPFCEVLGDFVCCTLAVNDGFAELNGDLLESFLDAFDSAGCGRREAKILAELTGFDEVVVYESFENYEFDVPQDVPKRDIEGLALGRFEELFRF